MPSEGQFKARLERALGVVEDGGRGSRLLDDGKRLAARVRRFIQIGVIAADTDATALDLACLALQLPLKGIRATPTGRLARPSLRERAEQAAEMLVGMLGSGDWRDNGGTEAEALLEETTRLLVEVRQRNPESDVARLLADAINLEDFGVIGLVEQAIAIARQGGGVSQVADGCEKREQYGYWEARLKDGFHFEQTRAIAKKRLDHTRRAATLLINELKEDGAL